MTPKKTSRLGEIVKEYEVVNFDEEKIVLRPIFTKEMIKESNKHWYEELKGDGSCEKKLKNSDKTKAISILAKKFNKNYRDEDLGNILELIIDEPLFMEDVTYMNVNGLDIPIWVWKDDELYTAEELAKVVLNDKSLNVENLFKFILND